MVYIAVADRGGVIESLFEMFLVIYSVELSERWIKSEENFAYSMICDDGLLMSEQAAEFEYVSGNKLKDLLLGLILH